MKLRIINSNSAGNCYVLESSTGQMLLIECGVNVSDIKKAIGFNVSKVAGCILTHEHKDHSGSIGQIMAAGINVYASLGTLNSLGATASHRAYAITEANGTVLKIGEFWVKPFDVKHDAAQPLGYLIRHRECGVVLFLTDSYYCEYKFAGLNQVIIEANYCQEIIDRKLMDSDKRFLRDRVIESHMSLQTCKETLKSYDLSAVKNIVLIHLSNSHSDAERFQREVEEQTGKMVHVADAGMEIDFNLEPF